MSIKGNRTIEMMMTVAVVFALLFGAARGLSLTGGDASQGIKSVSVKSLDTVILEALPGISHDLEGEVIPWWIFENKSGFRVINQTQMVKQVSLKMIYGVNPCNSEVTYEQTVQQSNERFELNSKQSSLVSNLSFLLQPLELALISVITDGEKCTIASDPRTFLGQVSTKLTIESPGEFNFSS